MSRSHPPISPARHAQGLAAYRSGQSFKDLMVLQEEIDRMHDEVDERKYNLPELTDEARAKLHAEHEEIAAAGPSVIAGFADGLLEDIRTIATAVRSRGNLRA